MANSHADSHDLDKLARWHRELLSESSGRFPAIAMFLVGPADRTAHDVFREFRASFEERGAEFQQLTIFGQHGVSTTERQLLAALGVPEESLPLLALFSDASATEAWMLRLIKGSMTGGSLDTPSGPGCNASAEPWRRVLDSVENAAGEPGPALNLAAVPGLVRQEIQTGTLEELVGRVLESVSTYRP